MLRLRICNFAAKGVRLRFANPPFSYISLIEIAFLFIYIKWKKQPLHILRDRNDSHFICIFDIYDSVLGKILNAVRTLTESSDGQDNKEEQKETRSTSYIRLQQIFKCPIGLHVKRSHLTCQGPNIWRSVKLYVFLVNFIDLMIYTVRNIMSPIQT